MFIVPLFPNMMPILFEPLSQRCYFEFTATALFTETCNKQTNSISRQNY